MKNRDVVLAVLTFVALAQGGRAWPQGAVSEADCPTYNHDPAGWRFNPTETTLWPKNVGALVETWRFPAEGSKETIGVVHATPAVVAGAVYFGTATFPTFYKLGPDGKLLWSYRNPARRSVPPTTAGATAIEKLYLLRADDGEAVRHTPLYTGPPTEPPAEHDRRVLALPGVIGGLQTGCATDGRTVFTNGIDALRLGSQPEGAGPGPDGQSRHGDVGRPRHRRMAARAPQDTRDGGTPGKPMYRDVGDVVGSGIAVGDGVAYFTAVGSGKLVALDVDTGAVLKEVDLGPVFAGPSLSRGRVYVSGGNVLWTPADYECYFSK